MKILYYTCLFLLGYLAGALTILILPLLKKDNGLYEDRMDDKVPRKSCSDP